MCVLGGGGGRACACGVNLYWRALRRIHAVIMVACVRPGAHGYAHSAPAPAAARVVPGRLVPISFRPAFSGRAFVITCNIDRPLREIVDLVVGQLVG